MSKIWLVTVMEATQIISKPCLAFLLVRWGMFTHHIFRYRRLYLVILTLGFCYSQETTRILFLVKQCNCLNTCMSWSIVFLDKN